MWHFESVDLDRHVQPHFKLRNYKLAVKSYITHKSPEKTQHKCCLLKWPAVCFKTNDHIYHGLCTTRINHTFCS